MRKRILTTRPTESAAPDGPWLDLETLAAVEVTSEDPAAPIEDALGRGVTTGWRAAQPGEQTIRVLFDAPQNLQRVQILFIEEARERSQEFVLSWSRRAEDSMREIVRQQYHFSPHGAVRELEDFKVALEGVRILELRITPDRSGGNAMATLAHLRVA